MVTGLWNLEQQSRAPQLSDTKKDRNVLKGNIGDHARFLTFPQTTFIGCQKS